MKKVVKGQKFAPKAQTWNAFIDAALYVKKRQIGITSQSLRKDTKSGLVLVRNSTGEGLDQFTVLVLGNLIIKPSDNEQDFRNNLPVFEAELITENNKDKPFVILQRPLKVNEVGAGMLTGITPVKIDIESDEHGFAELNDSGLKSSDSGSIRILWKESGTGKKWAVVQLGTPGKSTDKKGPFYIEQKDATTITIYGNNSDADRNFKANIILGASIEEFAEQDLTITTSGYVLLHITYDNEWVIEALNQATYTPDNSNQYIELGWVDLSGGVITNVIPYCSGSLSGEGGRVY